MVGRPPCFLPTILFGSMRLASKTNREAVEALNAVVGDAVVPEATIDLEAVKSLTVLFGQLSLRPAKGTLIVMLVADLDIRGETAPVYKGGNCPSSCLGR